MKKLLIPVCISILLLYYPLMQLFATDTEGKSNTYPNRNQLYNESTTSPKSSIGDRQAEERAELGIEKKEQNNPKSQRMPVGKEKVPLIHHDSIGILVNKAQTLPLDYAPIDLTVPDIPFTFEENLPKKKMRKEAARALEKLFTDAKRDGLQLAGVSAYRSYERQKVIFNHNVKIKGEAEAKMVSARPGESEHQTGLAIDVSCPAVGYNLSEEFGQTKEGKWLRKNAHKYGFIIRYPKDKEEITEYQYEPWHLRYVGQKIALEVTKNNAALEEYYHT